MSLVKETGISTDKECPPDYVEAHMTGCIRMQIVSIGRFDTLRDPAGFTIGYWNDPKPIRGNTVYGGEIRIFNQSITWQYREGNKGSRTFMLYPSRIYLDLSSSRPRKRQRTSSSTAPTSLHRYSQPRDGSSSTRRYAGTSSTQSATIPDADG